MRTSWRKSSEAGVGFVSGNNMNELTDLSLHQRGAGGFITADVSVVVSAASCVGLPDFNVSSRRQRGPGALTSLKKSSL